MSCLSSVRGLKIQYSLFIILSGLLLLSLVLLSELNFPELLQEVLLESFLSLLQNMMHYGDWAIFHQSVTGGTELQVTAGNAQGFICETSLVHMEQTRQDDFFLELLSVEVLQRKSSC